MWPHITSANRQGPDALDHVVRVDEREFFIDNLLVRIHFIIVMIRWTGLAPWESSGFNLIPAFRRVLRILG